MASGGKRKLKIDGGSLGIDDLGVISSGEVSLSLAPAARKRVVASRRVVDEVVKDHRVSYGINTGFGRFCNVEIDRTRTRELQVNLIRSHSAGVGDPLPEEVVRLALAFRANALAHGHSGVRPQVIDLLLELFNHDILPWIPSEGSVGASGDLAPLAHLAQALIGEGRVRYLGKWMSARGALKKAGLEPVKLEAKEGLALINGVQISSALLARALIDARHLALAADVIAALSLESLLGSASPFDRRIHMVRKHRGQEQVAAAVRKLIRGSKILSSHADCGRVQDPYSLRCVPQVHGAVRDAIDWIQGVLVTEINSATDNPLVFPEDSSVISGGNFHGAPIGYAADLLAIVLTDLGSISERRVERLVNPDHSGLPAFLSTDVGFQSGWMMAQVSAASLVSSNKVLAHPASVDSIPTSANTEDHVSMSTHAAAKACTVARASSRVLGIEMLIALDAIEHRRPLRSGKSLEKNIALLRAELPLKRGDRDLNGEIEKAGRLVLAGVLPVKGR